MNRPTDENPSFAEFGKLRAYLALKGVSQIVINECIPVGAHSTMTRSEIVEQMKTMCQDFSKAP